MKYYILYKSTDYKFVPIALALANNPCTLRVNRSPSIFLSITWWAGVFFLGTNRGLPGVVSLFLRGSLRVHQRVLWEPQDLQWWSAFLRFSKHKNSEGETELLRRDILAKHEVTFRQQYESWFSKFDKGFFVRCFWMKWKALRFKQWITRKSKQIFKSINSSNIFLYLRYPFTMFLISFLGNVSQSDNEKKVIQ